MRALGVAAVGSVVAGWGVAQYPDLLGTHLALRDAAAPEATLRSVVAVFATAAALCVPSLALLYAFGQRGRLDEVVAG